MANINLVKAGKKALLPPSRNDPRSNRLTAHGKEHRRAQDFESNRLTIGFFGSLATVGQQWLECLVR